MCKAIVSIVLIVVPGLYFGYLGKPTEMGLAIVAGALAAAFLNIDRIQRFKGAGFEAEMKQTVEKANATIEELKELAKPLILVSADLLTMAGRFGGMSSEQKYPLMKQLETTAQSLALNDNDIQKAITRYYGYRAMDCLVTFIDRVIKDCQLDTGTEQRLRDLKNYKSLDLPDECKIMESLGGLKETLGDKHHELLRRYLDCKAEHDAK